MQRRNYCKHSPTGCVQDFAEHFSKLSSLSSDELLLLFLHFLAPDFGVRLFFGSVSFLTSITKKQPTVL